MESVSQAKELYGLIHNRFITTSKGLALIREKYLNGVYGHCPRILCDKQILLPVGLSEDLKYSRVKV
jgi:casein kinase II subunit beta